MLDHEEWVAYWRGLLPPHLASLKRIAKEHHLTEDKALKLMQVVLLNLVLSSLTPDDEPWQSS